MELRLKNAKPQWRDQNTPGRSMHTNSVRGFVRGSVQYNRENKRRNLFRAGRIKAGANAKSR